MKLFSQLLVLGLAAEGIVASSWFSKAGEFLKLTFVRCSITLALPALLCTETLLH